MTRGHFITLEGGEGAGKSTQAQLLADYLRQCALPVLLTREPGGIPNAEAIRHLLIHGAADPWLAETEALLVAAARMEHLRRVIEPALTSGQWVICDRFIDSTLVYQGLAKGLGTTWLMQLHRLIAGNLMPDVTLYFDIDPAIGLKRTAARAEGATRFEAEPLAFHQQLREGFLALQAADSSRIIRIDASGDMSDIATEVQRVMTRYFAQMGRVSC